MKTNQKLQHIRQAEHGSLTDLGKVLTEVVEPTSPVRLPTFTVANAPTASEYTGHLIYVSNGAAGSEIVAFSDGTDWLRVDTGAAIAAA